MNRRPGQGRRLCILHNLFTRKRLLCQIYADQRQPALGDQRNFHLLHSFGTLPALDRQRNTYDNPLTDPQSRGRAGRAGPVRPRSHGREDLPAGCRGRGAGRQADPLPRGIHPGLPARAHLRDGDRRPERRGAAHVGALLGQLGRRAQPGHGGARARPRARPAPTWPSASSSATGNSAAARSTARRSISARTAACWASIASSSRPRPSAWCGARGMAAR